jgi:ATP-dependent helicase IRC3
VESEACITNGPLDVPTPRSVTFTEHDNPFLGNSDKGPRHIAALSSLSWVDCGGDIYVLELLTRGFVRIELDGEGILFC